MGSVVQLRPHLSIIYQAGIVMFPYWLPKKGERSL